MNRGGSDLHPSDPAYDPVLDGVSRGLADLFPPIHNPPRGEDSSENDAGLYDADGGATTHHKAYTAGEKLGTNRSSNGD